MSRSTLSRLSTDCWSRINQVSIKYRLECWLSINRDVNQEYPSSGITITRVLINTRPQIYAYCIVGKRENVRDYKIQKKNCIVCKSLRGFFGGEGVSGHFAPWLYRPQLVRPQPKVTSFHNRSNFAPYKSYFAPYWSYFAPWYNLHVYMYMLTRLSLLA